MPERGSGSRVEDSGDAARGKKHGPPCGHLGVSHCNRPSMTLMYDLDSMVCVWCGAPIRMIKPLNKLVSDPDGSMRMLTVNAIIQDAVCPQCGSEVAAATPVSRRHVAWARLALIMNVL